MVLEQTKSLTAEAFERFTELPENADKLFEFIGGEIYEVPSNPHSSKISITIATYLRMYTFSNRIGHVTGEAGGYWVSGERYAPDVAFISFKRQPKLVKNGYNPNPPELAVEVISPTDSQRKFAIKLANYLAAGTTLWAVYDDDEQIHVYAPGQPVRILGIEDVLEAEDILPGFKLPVKAIFSEEDEEKEES